MSRSCTTALVREFEDVPAEVNGDYRRPERERDLRINMAALRCYSTKTRHQL